MNEQERHNLFSELVIRHRSELYGYIYAVVRNWNDADDLFQSVCLVLWSKFETFQPGTSFFAWARQTAKIKLANFLRRRPTPSHVSEMVLNAISDVPVEVPAAEYLTALQQCRSKLAAIDDELLKLRYVENLGSCEIAERVGRTQQSVCQSLKRIRRKLLKCIRSNLSQQDHPHVDCHE